MAADDIVRPENPQYNERAHGKRRSPHKWEMGISVESISVNPGIQFEQGL
jgi:hypothetical protein